MGNRKLVASELFENVQQMKKISYQKSLLEMKLGFSLMAKRQNCSFQNSTQQHH